MKIKNIVSRTLAASLMAASVLAGIGATEAGATTPTTVYFSGFSVTVGGGANLITNYTEMQTGGGSYITVPAIVIENPLVVSCFLKTVNIAF